MTFCRMMTGTMASSSLLLFLVFTVLVATPAAIFGEEPERVEKEQPAPSPEGASASDATMYFPSGRLYPTYAADVHRIGFGVQLLNFTDTQIPDSGDTRVAIRAGSRFGIVRITSEGGRAWQFDVEGGFNAQFDQDHSLDNIGWDGRYGLSVATARTDRLAFKFGVLHDSSHVGDEYIERTGRTRIGYTRHELAAGA